MTPFPNRFGEDLIRSTGGQGKEQGPSLGGPQCGLWCTVIVALMNPDVRLGMCMASSR